MDLLSELELLFDSDFELEEDELEESELDDEEPFEEPVEDDVPVPFEFPFA